MGTTTSLDSIITTTTSISTNPPVTMKVCVFILAVLAVGCYAPDISVLIQAEVKAIIAASPRITLTDCATKCDAEFDLIAGRDEQLMDRACHDACDCAINHNNCHGHNTGHVTRPHVTHRPHGTRAPAPTNGGVFQP